MSDDYDDDHGFACPPRPLRPSRKRVTIHQHSQRTVTECEGPYGLIHIESTSTITIETVVEDDLPPYASHDAVSEPAMKRLLRRRQR